MAAAAGAMTATQLRQHILQCQQELEGLRRNISDIYGEVFTGIVGGNKIFDIPEMDARELHLDNPGEYPEDRVTPGLFKAATTRGIMGDGRPFIAIKVELLDPATGAVVAKVVEVIFKRYSLQGDGGKGQAHEHHYVSVQSNRGDDGKRYPSLFQPEGRMDKAQMEALRDLLQDKTVDPRGEQSLQQGYLVRMARA